MRIAFSADGPAGLDSGVHPHFGRCPYFVLVDVEGQAPKSVHTVENPYFHGHEPGQVPQFVHEQGADVMVTGGMGERAVQLFEQLGVEPITGAAGSVRESLAAYLAGELNGAGSCAESHEHGHGA